MALASALVLASPALGAGWLNSGGSQAHQVWGIDPGQWAPSNCIVLSNDVWIYSRDLTYENWTNLQEHVTVTERMTRCALIYPINPPLMNQTNSASVRYSCWEPSTNCDGGECVTSLAYVAHYAYGFLDSATNGVRGSLALQPREVAPWQLYEAYKERWARICWTTNGWTNFPLMLSFYYGGTASDANERDNLVRLKNAYKPFCTNFADVDIEQPPPRGDEVGVNFTASNLLRYCDLPTNYWEFTPLTGLMSDVGYGRVQTCRWYVVDGNPDAVTTQVWQDGGTEVVNFCGWEMNWPYELEFAWHTNVGVFSNGFDSRLVSLRTNHNIATGYNSTAYGFRGLYAIVNRLVATWGPDPAPTNCITVRTMYRQKADGFSTYRDYYETETEAAAAAAEYWPVRDTGFWRLWYACGFTLSAVVRTNDFGNAAHYYETYGELSQSAPSVALATTNRAKAEIFYLWDTIRRLLDGYVIDTNKSVTYADWNSLGVSLADLALGWKYQQSFYCDGTNVAVGDTIGDVNSAPAWPLSGASCTTNMAWPYEYYRYAWTHGCIKGLQIVGAKALLWWNVRDGGLSYVTNWCD